MEKSEKKKGFLKRNFNRIAAVGIIAIPTIYTSFFLGSMWDPYGKTENLPVAVVNNDKPVMYNDAVLNIGENLVENLEENDSLAFNFVDSSVAEKGLENGTYYMVITIPENFSENASTVMDDEPKKMILNYKVNPGTNYIASKMSESAMVKLQKSVQESVVEEYTKTVFEQLGTIGDGMSEATDGAGKLRNGVSDLRDGNRTISENLKTLAESTVTFEEGFDTLKEGLKDYTDGVVQVNDGVSKLSGGADSLKNGTAALLNGLNTLADTIDGSMNEESRAGIAQVTAGLTALNSGIQELDSSLKNADMSMDMSGLMNVMNTSLTGIGADAQSIGSGLQEMGDTLTSLMQSPVFQSLPPEQQAALSAQIMSSMENMAAAASDIGENVKGISDAVSSAELDRKISTLNTSMETLRNSVGVIAQNSDILLPAAGNTINSLSAGLTGVQDVLERNGESAENTGIIQAASAINSGSAELKNGISSLSDGTEKLVSNNEKLLSGSDELSDGTSKLSDGSAKLYDGSLKLGDGLVELYDGCETLETSLEDGASEINEVNREDRNSSMFAAPVETEETVLTNPKNNGQAMSAYMMSVGLWVGCLAYCLMFSPDEAIEKKNIDKKSAVHYWAREMIKVLAVASASAVLMVGVLSAALGFSPVSMPKTIGIACMSAMAFMMLFYFFNMLMGKIGSFILLVFMVLQLSGAAGTYPIELSDSFYQKIHPFMPFTYTVNAFRSTTASGLNISKELTVLVSIFAVFFVLNFAAVYLKAAKSEKHEENKNANIGREARV